MGSHCGSVEEGISDKQNIFGLFQKLESWCADFLICTGLPEFSCLNIPNGEKYTKYPQNYQMAVTHTKWP
jgi:hypothetical protein